jgi:hypothetical protein
MSNQSAELTRREERAQHGIIEFAEELQVIRDKNLYPNAGQTDAWESYCKERWGQSDRMIRKIIAVAPVLKRRAATTDASGNLVSAKPTMVSAATEVATIDSPTVQDEILDNSKTLEKIVMAGVAHGTILSLVKDIHADVEMLAANYLFTQGIEKALLELDAIRDEMLLELDAIRDEALLELDAIRDEMSEADIEAFVQLLDEWSEEHEAA